MNIRMVDVLESHERDVKTRLKDLIDRRFSRRFVFHESRWNEKGGMLARAFERRRYELGDVSFSDAWHLAAEPVLAVALLSMPDDMADGKRIPWVRSYLRREIERDLLGRTTDAKQEVLVEDSKEAQAQRRLDEIETEEAARDGQLLILREFLSSLTSDEQAILLADHGSDASLAGSRGVSLRTIGRWRAKLRQMLEDFLWMQRDPG